MPRPCASIAQSPTDHPLGRGVAAGRGRPGRPSECSREPRSTMFNPLICERCGRDLDIDDAISIIEGICTGCRQTAEGRSTTPFRDSAAPTHRAASGDPLEEFLRQSGALRTPTAGSASVSVIDELVAAVAPRRRSPTAEKPTGTHPGGPIAEDSRPILESDSSRLSLDDLRGDTPIENPTGLSLGADRQDDLADDSAELTALLVRQMHQTQGGSGGLQQTASSPGSHGSNSAHEFAGAGASRESQRGASPHEPLGSASPHGSEGAGLPHESLAAVSPHPATASSTGRHVAVVRSVRSRAADGTPPNVPLHVEPRRPRSRSMAWRRRRDLAIGVGSGLLLTAAFAAYFIIFSEPAAMTPTPESGSTVPMTVRVAPSWAEVTLDGRVIRPDEDTGRIDLPSTARSDSLLEVSAEGYHPVRRPLGTFGGVADVSIALVQCPFELTIQTEPPGADVLIDGELKGRSPLTLSLLPEHDYAMAVSLAGYATVEQAVTAPEQGASKFLDFALQPVGVTVRVETDPAGAAITLDGEARGVSPQTINLDPSYLSKGVEITACLPGYEAAVARVALPSVGGPEPIVPRIALVPKPCEIEVATTPPGGRVLVDGWDHGPAPVTLRFDPARVGTPVSIAAMLDGSHYGRQDQVVPPPGESLRIVIPLEFDARRIVFVVNLAQETSAEVALARDAAIEAIERLSSDQRFALVAAADDKPEVWPGRLGTEAASSEQKVRAYDVVRSLRTVEDAKLSDLLKLALKFQPSVLYVFSTVPVEQEAILSLGDGAAEQDICIHVAHPASGDPDDWLRRWVAQHRGTLTHLDALSEFAMGESEE